VDAAKQFVKPFDMTDDDVLQLWGEAVGIYKKGFTLTFDEDFEDELAVYKERFTYRDEAENQIYDYLDMLVPEEWDSINYILEPEDLQAVFFCVSESLKEGGIFIFDINTPYKYEVLMADNTIAENRDEGSFIWDNYYDADEKINEYDLTLFIKEQSEDEDDIYK
jgi:hypothetical protein